jgi:hypothetical protein
MGMETDTQRSGSLVAVIGWVPKGRLGRGSGPFPSQARRARACTPNARPATSERCVQVAPRHRKRRCPITKVIWELLGSANSRPQWPRLPRPVGSAVPNSPADSGSVVPEVTEAIVMASRTRLPAGSSCLRSTQCDSSSSPPAAAWTMSDHSAGVHRPFPGPRYAPGSRCSVTVPVLHLRVGGRIADSPGQQAALGSRPSAACASCFARGSWPPPTSSSRGRDCLSPSSPGA